MRSRIIVLSAVFVAAACSSKDASSTPPAANASASTTGVPAAATSSPEPTANEISNYTLDMDKMNRYLNAMKNFALAATKDTSVEALLSMDGNATMAQSVARLEASPVARNALSAAGMSPQDYVMTTMAYLQAGMTAGLMKSVPNYKVPAGQNMKNVDFMNQHGTEIEAKMKQMQEGMQD